MAIWRFYTGEFGCLYCEKKVELTIDWDNPPDKLGWQEDRNSRLFEPNCPYCKQPMNVSVLLQTHTTIHGKDAVLKIIRGKEAIQDAKRLLKKKGYTISAPAEETKDECPR